MYKLYMKLIYLFKSKSEILSHERSEDAGKKGEKSNNDDDLCDFSGFGTYHGKISGFMNDISGKSG